MTTFQPTDHQHLRWNPLRGDWVLVSPHRMNRPWSGQVEKLEEDKIPPHDINNPLCPRATRPNGQTNPDYESTFVFPNDFPALLEDVPDPPSESEEDPLFRTKAARGTCRVMCFHPHSNVTLPLMTKTEVRAIINRWMSEMDELSKKYTWVQIFENRGTMMGCSNPHPHCQIWASSFLPNEPRIKDEKQREYFTKYGRAMLMDYVEKEVKEKVRIVVENSNWIVVVPYWAVWPYETMMLPRRRVSRMTDLTEDQQEDLADIIQKITAKYDNLFECSFPYSMGWHGAPTGPNYDGESSEHWTFHGCYYPPLLRSATIKKFMVGYEMLAQPQRDLTAEQAALKLRQLPDVHYKLLNK